MFYCDIFWPFGYFVHIVMFLLSLKYAFACKSSIVRLVNLMCKIVYGMPTNVIFSVK